VKRAQQTLQYYATFDEMTGLVNRRTGLLMLATAMSRSRRDGTTLSVCYVDLDGLKSVNDCHGHHEGDWLIKTLATALLASIRDGDVAIRLGGDEFLLILHDCPVEHSLPVLDRIRSQLDHAAHEKADSYPISASLGLATYEANRHLTPEDLVNDADLRMYEAKQAKRAARGPGDTQSE
jgi:diguanylate cyclase (GGDEF)-like protein